MCRHPLIIKSRLVPCGKCDECINKKWKHLYSRVSAEYNTSPVTLMLTLTYDNRNLAKASKNDISLFFKRFRFKYPKAKFKYYWCIEKGKENGRIHYHVLMFFSNNVIYHAFDFNYCWNRGFIKVQRVKSAKACGYTLKYVYKDAFKTIFPKNTRKFGSSANLGLEFYLKSEDFMKHLQFSTLSAAGINVDQKLVGAVLKRRAKAQDVAFLQNYIDSSIIHNLFFMYSSSKPLSNDGLISLGHFYAREILLRKVFCCDFLKYLKGNEGDLLLEYYYNQCNKANFYCVKDEEYTNLLPKYYYGNHIPLNYESFTNFEYVVIL